jgi:hypothetical protein
MRSCALQFRGRKSFPDDLRPRVFLISERVRYIAAVAAPAGIEIPDWKLKRLGSSRVSHAIIASAVVEFLDRH